MSSPDPATERKILTEQTTSKIPAFRWEAGFEDDLKGPRGVGRTEQDAISDLKAQTKGRDE